MTKCQSGHKSPIYPLCENRLFHGTLYFPARQACYMLVIPLLSPWKRECLKVVSFGRKKYDKMAEVECRDEALQTLHIGDETTSHLYSPNVIAIKSAIHKLKFSHESLYPWCFLRSSIRQRLYLPVMMIEMLNEKIHRLVDIHFSCIGMCK